MRKGIILAGGTGSRLFPITQAVSKQLLPVYDKPLIYYPLSTLMLSGIRDILIISTPRDLSGYQNLFGDGTALGLNIAYCEQAEPKGIAHALILAEDFIADEPCALVLGDNIFYGHDFIHELQQADLSQGATVLAYAVNNPEAYGVLELDGDRVVGIVEKPVAPKSNYAVTGLYFYDQHAVELAKSLKPSARGELEITDLNRCYLAQGKLQVIRMGRGSMWFDGGTPASLLQASHFVESVQVRQGFMIACPEEIAYQKEYIDERQLMQSAELLKNGYGSYLLNLIEGEN